MSVKSSAIKLLMGIIRPGASASILARAFCWLFRLIPIRKDTARRNLEIALPDATPEDRRRMLRETYDSLVWTGVEFAALQRNPKLALEWVKVENSEALDRSGGAILLACHVGNWELAAAWVAQSGHKISAIVRESKDAAERSVIAAMRANAGVECIPKTSSMTKAIGVLRRGEFLAIMPDQHGGGEGVTVPLFGHKTQTPQGPAVFAYLTKKPIIPTYMRRVAPFKHLMRFGEPLRWDDKGNRDATILSITEAVNAELEKIIREAPGQWLAQHRRFREHY